MEIVWTDASINCDHEAIIDDETTTRNFGGLVTCRDIGYLIHKDRKTIKLAVSLCPDDNTFRHSNTIPRGWVREIIFLTRLNQEVSNAQAQENQVPDPDSR